MAGVRQFDEMETLRRALEVFWEKGIGPTTMQDLAQATGVQRGSLYNAYRTKEELFLKVYEQYKEKILAEARAALDKPSIDSALRSFFNWAIESMTMGTPPRGCLTTKNADMASTNEVIRGALRGFLDELEEVLRVRCAADDARGRLAVEPAEAARLVVTYSRGIVVMERIYQDPAGLRASANLLVQVLVPQR
jgi:AcrR family transcriptional regulator